MVEPSSDPSPAPAHRGGAAPQCSGAPRCQTPDAPSGAGSLRAESLRSEPQVWTKLTLAGTHTSYRGHLNLRTKQMNPSTFYTCRSVLFLDLSYVLRWGPAPRGPGFVTILPAPCLKHLQ